MYTATQKHLLHIHANNYISAVVFLLFSVFIQCIFYYILTHTHTHKLNLSSQVYVYIEITSQKKMICEKGFLVRDTVQNIQIDRILGQ